MQIKLTNEQMISEILRLQGYIQPQVLSIEQEAAKALAAKLLQLPDGNYNYRNYRISLNEGKVTLRVNTWEKDILPDENPSAFLEAAQGALCNEYENTKYRLSERCDVLKKRIDIF